MNNPWWSNSGGFFGARYIEGDESYEGYLPENKETLEQRTKREVDGIINLLGLTESSEVLDCPCGYGRHSIELALKGIFTYGVDINKEHLKQARRESTRRVNALARQKGIPFGEYLFFENKHHAGFQEIDMRWINSKAALGIVRPFDAVINMFYSFGFFETDEENEKVMKEFYDCLKPNGQLLLHTDVSPEIIESGKYNLNEVRRLKSGRSLKIVEVYDEKTKRMNGSWTLIDKKGSQERLTPYSVRIYSKEEFEEMTKKTGFRETRFYGSFEGHPFSKNSQELILVARK